MSELDLSIDAAAERLRTLGHSARLTIMMTLAGREMAVGEIETVTAIAQPALSQQLAILRKAELVLTRREGKQVIYSLNGPAIDQLCVKMGKLEGTVTRADPQIRARSAKFGSAARFAQVD